MPVLIVVFQRFISLHLCLSFGPDKASTVSPCAEFRRKSAKVFSCWRFEREREGKAERGKESDREREGERVSVRGRERVMFCGSSFLEEGHNKATFCCCRVNRRPSPLSSLPRQKFTSSPPPPHIRTCQGHQCGAARVCLKATRVSRFDITLELSAVLTRRRWLEATTTSASFYFEACQKFIPRRRCETWVFCDQMCLKKAGVEILLCPGLLRSKSHSPPSTPAAPLG